MISRVLSLLLSISLSLVLLFAAPMFAQKIHGMGRGILMIVLIGIAGGFIHGVGFQPRHFLFKCLFNPWVSRILMLSILFFYF
jgi:cyd operon protein YbgE